MNGASEQDVERALKYLRDTDEPYAQARAHRSAMEHRLKTIKAQAFLEAEGTQGEREQKAYDSPAYREALNDYENSFSDEPVYAAKRKRAELTIEVWRSINAGQRRGNV